MDAHTIKQLVGGNHMQDSIPSEGRSSPRKRKRSPDEVANAKVQKSGNGHDFDDDDDLDTICSAALEEYEQTQREWSSSPIKNTASGNITSTLKPHIPVAHSISTSVRSKTLPNAAENARAKVPTLSQPVGSRYGAGNAPGVNPLQVVTGSLGSAASGRTDEEERIRLLQEQNYTKDGEVKLLRSEKERMMGEMRKQEERMRKMQATLLAEKQAMEKKLTKEKDALATQLQFKEQELKEKCALLEQRSQETSSSQLSRMSPVLSRSQPQKTTPSSSSRTPVLRAQARKKGPTHNGKQTEFLSSETFMPLSQLSSSGVAGVTPVCGGPHRWDVLAGNRGRGQSMAASRSRSISPNPSDMKKMKKRSVSDKGRGSSPQGRLEFSEKGGRKRTFTLPADVGGIVEDLTSPESAGEPLLPAPKRELDGAQILLLLVNQNLLKPPVFPGSLQAEQRLTLMEEGGGGSSISSNLLSFKEEDKISGLLSLLHIETKPSFAPIVGGYATPSERYDESVNLQQQSFDSEQSCGSTPTRRPYLLPHPKAHTLGRTNLAKSRIRHSSALLNATKRSHSTANTPFKPSLSAAPDSASISLLSSIDPDSLNKNIGNLLVSSEVNRFDSFTNRSKGSLLSSVVKPHSGEGPDPVTEILKQIGQIITSYHHEQLNKTKSSNYSSESSESTGSDSFLFSPKSSTTGSRTGSDLAAPLAADQLLVMRALEILEVLVTYSKNVREQILLQPPEFIIDSRPLSSLGIHQNSPLNVSLEARREKGETSVSRLAEVSHRLVTSQQQDSQAGETSGTVSSMPQPPTYSTKISKCSLFLH